MNGDDLARFERSVEKVMNTHVSYLREDIQQLSTQIDQVHKDTIDNKLEVAKLKVSGMKNAGWISGIVSVIINGIFAGIESLVRRMS